MSISERGEIGVNQADNRNSGSVAVVDIALSDTRLSCSAV